MAENTPTPNLIVRHKAPAATPELRHRRGEVWLVTANPEQPAVGTEIWSNRPAIIVSNNVLNARSGFAEVVYLSSAARKRSGPTHVEVPGTEGGTSMALCEQVHTVDASRLQRKLAALPTASMRDIDAALAISLSIGRNPDTHTLFRKWEEQVKTHGIDIAREITALSGLTTDQRVDALTRALRLMTIERDAYRNLYEASPARTDALEEVATALGTTGV